MDGTFAATGALQPAYRAVDWAATSLGAPESWSPTLRAAVDLMLGTRFPVTLLWGPDLVLVYNEAYTTLIGDKHPAALGRRTRDVFPEVWPTIGPMLEGVLAGGEATWVADTRMLLERHGYPEECFFTFSYSPVGDGEGNVEGVIDITAETTPQVVGRRRMELLARLGSELADAQTRADVAARTVRLLSTVPADIAHVDLSVQGVLRTGGTEGLAADPAAPVGEPVVLETTVDGAARVAVRLSDLDGSEPDTLLMQLPGCLPLDRDHLEFLGLLAGMVVQALDRARARESERRDRAVEREMSEALQHSLLGPPLHAAHVDVAVRYVTAVEQVEVGGDWYDSFLLADGTLALVVGDVTGHDQRAAAAMAQARNLVRGSEFAVRQTPAEVLRRLDGTMASLRSGFYATAVVAHVDVDNAPCRMTWSNAGHPPPVLLRSDGSARLLATDPELLLGVLSGTSRNDHEVTLEPGDALVLYTDGLLDERRLGLGAAIDQLVDVVAGQQQLDSEQLCDHILHSVPGPGDDDVVLLVARVRN